MAKISFKVSARTARLIGQENFANADGALIELVKNCYDADAKNSVIFFDNKDEDLINHSIYIIDNGDGMTSDIIENQWMTIGTDNKEDDFETTSGRIKTGAKGIGRFALDRLGELAEMYTLSKDAESGCYWKVNWNDFKQKGAVLADVKATLDPLPNFNLVDKIRELHFPRVDAQIAAGITFDTGTIIKISRLREPWSNEELDKLFENLEILIPPKEQPTFTISLFSKRSQDEYGDLNGAYYDDYDYKVSALSKDNSVDITITRKELDTRRLESEYIEVFKNPLMKAQGYDLESFKAGKIKYSLPLNELIKGLTDAENSRLLDKVGDFFFTFYFLKNSKNEEKSEANIKRFPYRDFNSTTRRAWLKKFGGVKIFRDDFRVRPYGEFGEDWLKLGERHAQSPQGVAQRIGAYRVRPNQISGTIGISRVANFSFQDKSGREGIQENEVFELFKSLIKAIISEFEKDRNVIMYSLSELGKNRDKAEEAIKLAAEEAARVLAAQNASNQNPSANSSSPLSVAPATIPTPTEVTLAHGLQAQEEEIEEKDIEIRLLRSLSGTGLIVASFAHELRSLRSLLVSRTDDLKSALEKILPKNSLEDLPSEDNPISMLNLMREQDVQIKHWLEYSLTALRKDKRTRSNIDIEDYFKSFKENWNSALNRRKVNLVIENNLKHAVEIRGFAIDFDTVFNNLLINSLDSFKRRKDLTQRYVEISINRSATDLIIQFADNGIGLSTDYQKSPADIFNAFETSKVDRKGNKIGTGIGMYLAKTIIDDYSGEIRITGISNGFKLEIILPIKK